MGPSACCTRALILLLLLLLLDILLTQNVSAECGPPKAPSDMILSDETLKTLRFPEGTSGTLECDDLYEKVSGTGRVTCSGGKWSEPDLLCTKKNCGVPPPQPNTIFDLRGGTIVGDVIRVRCESGYQLRGMGYRMCFGFGWFGSSRCEVKNCRTPVPSANMTVFVPNGTLYGATFEVSCQKGYDLIGSSVRKCEADGWSGSARCERKRCKAPGPLANGRSSWNTEDAPMFKQTVHYDCNRGFVLNGTSAIVCQENGEYDHPPPTCHFITCKAPDKPANGENSWNSSGTITPGHAIHYVCNRGFALNGPSAVVCQENGEFDHPPPTCGLVTCRAPGELANGQHLRVGRTIRYQCNKGFVLNGSNTSVCQEDGEFDHRPPTCDAVTCKAPGALTNGETSWRTENAPTFGQAIHYVCHEGYTLSGKNATVCQENGEYNYMPPTCHGDEALLKHVGESSPLAALLLVIVAFIGVALVGIVVARGYIYRRTRSYYFGRDQEEEPIASYHCSSIEEPVQ